MKKLTTLIVCSLLLGACTMVPKDDIEVTSDVDTRINFAGFKTYEWLGSIGIVNDPEGSWQPVGFDLDAEIEFLIDRELRKRGIAETTGGADMLVGYAAGVDMAALKEKIDPDTDMASWEEVPQGALVIALIDPVTGLAIFVGSATAEIRNLPVDQVKARLDYTVSQIISQLPK